MKFFVPGKPAPQGSKRHVGNGRMIESSREVGPWRERVALAAAGATGGILPPGTPVAVTLDFRMPRPASAPKRSTPQAVKRPDLDKLIRACLDALTHVVFTDDSAVVAIHSSKRLCEVDETPGVQITVERCCV